MTTPMKVHGTIRVPGDKSISHRVLMLAALGSGRSRIRGVLESADVHSTAAVLRAWGVDVPPLGADIVVSGVGTRGLRAPSQPLDCGNSGTSARLLAGIAAGQTFASTFIGDASLSRRPMARVAKPLTQMGATVELPDHGGLPMTIRGGLLGSIDYVSDVASGQIKSAVLLAGVVGGVAVSVTEPTTSRDHTERMLRARGVRVRTERAGDATRVVQEAADRLDSCDSLVAGDPSSAAFFAGLAAMSTRGELLLGGVGVNETRLGALGALARMGAAISYHDRDDAGGEPVASVRVAAGSLRGITLGGLEIPSLIDELPLIACVAARADGETLVTGAAELRVKESDRISTVVDNLRALGATAEELPDGFRIVGSDRPLRGTVRTHGDHRIAMAFGVLGAVPGNDISVDDRECVAVSYPAFWADLVGAVSR